MRWQNETIQSLQYMGAGHFICNGDGALNTCRHLSQLCIAMHIMHYDYTKVFFHLRIHNDRSQILLLRAFFCRLCPNDVLLMNMTWQITG